MDTEPDPPQRPRRTSAAGLLVVLALACLGVWLVGILGLAFGTSVFSGRASQVETSLLYGPLIATVVLLGASLVFRLRQQ